MKKATLNGSRHVHWEDLLKLKASSGKGTKIKADMEGIKVSNLISNTVYSQRTPKQIKKGLSKTGNLIFFSRKNSVNIKKERGDMHETPRTDKSDKGLKFNFKALTGNFSKKKKFDLVKKKRRSLFGKIRNKYVKKNMKTYSNLHPKKTFFAGLTYSPLKTFQENKQIFAKNKTFSFTKSKIKENMSKSNKRKNLSRKNSVSKTPNLLRFKKWPILKFNKTMVSKSRNLSPVNFFKINANQKKGEANKNSTFFTNLKKNFSIQNDFTNNIPKSILFVL